MRGACPILSAKPLLDVTPAYYRNNVVGYRTEKKLDLPLSPNSGSVSVTDRGGQRGRDRKKTERESAHAKNPAPQHSGFLTDRNGL